MAIAVTQLILQQHGFLMTELLVLSGEDLRRLMRFEDYIDAVAAAFALHADGKSFAPAPVQIPGIGQGTFHIKAASLALGPGYVAIKVNANFPQNRVAGLPTIQGAVLLFNVTNGNPLALLDSAEITAQRTAAATAIAARHLARPESTVATVCGCGKQGGLQLLALIMFSGCGELSLGISNLKSRRHSRFGCRLSSG